MRSFLFWVARMLVGFATLSAVLTLLRGAPADVLVAAVGMWIVALLIGLVLSAPYALAPPGSSMAFGFSLPILWWIFLFAFIFVGWVGRMVLQGAWGLIGLIWQPRQPAPVGIPTGGPGVLPGVPVVPPNPALPAAPSAGPSWQRDPTGRNLQRYWDGQRDRPRGERIRHRHRPALAV